MLDRSFNNDERWNLTCCFAENCVLIAVVYVQRPNEKYAIPWSEAEAECQARGMTLASRDDMLESRALGLDICACGWLSDGTCGLVQVTYRPGCGFSNENKVYSCTHSKADVYCKWI